MRPFRFGMLASWALCGLLAACKEPPTHPTGVPGAPTGVTAQPRSRSALVKWEAPEDPGSSPITSYTVKSNPTGPSFTVRADELQVVVDSLENGTPYTFTVHATNAAGAGPPSAASAPITPADPPGAPRGVSAAAGNRSATVSWSAPSTTGGSRILRYTVVANPGGATTSTEGDSRGATVSGLQNGTPYTFTVFASNAVGDGPPSAPSQAVTPRGPPEAPTGVVAAIEGRNVRVTWTAPANGGSPITGYTVLPRPTGYSVDAAHDATSALVTGLSENTRYTFVVRARNNVGIGAPSEPSPEILTPQRPDAPRDLQATPGDKEVLLSWSPPASDGRSPILKYQVTWGWYGPVETTTTSARIAGLNNGTSYVFSISAVNAVGTGPAVVSQAVVPGRVPGPPTDVSAVAGSGYADVSWSAPTDPGSHPITLYTVKAEPGGTVVTTTGALTARVPGLDNGATYTFTVFATNTIGVGAPATSPPITLPLPPGAPAVVEGSGVGCEARVRWTAPASDGGSPILRYALTVTPGGHSVRVGPEVRSAAVPRLRPGNYAVTVRAANLVGDGPASAPVSVTVPGCKVLQLPDPPTLRLDVPPRSIARADLDGDGALDLVLATDAGPRLLLGHGDGTFDVPRTVDATPADHVVAVDLDGNGRPDLATIDEDDAKVRVYLDDGAGGFKPRVTYETGVDNRLLSIAAGDTDGDGDTDLVVGVDVPGWAADGVTVLRNTGNGTLALQAFHAAQGALVGLADLNGDGKPEVITSSTSTIYLLRNRGDGTFQATNASYGFLDEAVALSVVDVDGQGPPELLFADASGRVEVFSVDAGSLEVTSKGRYPVPSPRGLTTVDLDGDARLDIVVAGARSASVLRNLGGGTFAPAVQYPETPGLGVAAGDLDGNSRADLAILGSNQVRILLSGAGGLIVPSYLTGGDAPEGLASSDLDGDGDVDLVVTNYGEGTVGVYLNHGDGTYAEAMVHQAGNHPARIAIGDLDADGKPDLVVTNHGTAAASVLLNAGGGVFTLPVSWSTGAQPLGLLLEDLNADGKLDLAVASSGGGTVGVRLGNGDGTFGPEMTVSAGTRPWGLVAGELNGDGRPDLAVSDYAGNSVHVLFGHGDGTFSPVLASPVGQRPTGIIARDLDRDGDLDLATSDRIDGTVSLLLSNGNGKFAPAQAVAAESPGALSLAAGDLDGDGWAELIVAGTNLLTVIPNANGLFLSPVPYGESDHQVLVNDLDGDGRLDLVTSIPWSARLAIRLNRGPLPGPLLSAKEGW